MTDGQFWFVMISLLILLDALSYVERGRDQKAHRIWLAEYDAESARRHKEFMDALAVERQPMPLSMETVWPGHRMDADGGPQCECGKPSAHESGWCGGCA